MNSAISARTLLFVPATRPERFDKALAAEPDLGVIDLKDAVFAEAKTAARDIVKPWRQEADPALRSRMAVRINGAGTPWHSDDVSARAAPDQILMVPQAAAGAGLENLGDGPSPSIALIETAAGAPDARTVAAAPSVCRLVFGSFDLAAELGIDPADRNALAQLSTGDPLPPLWHWAASASWAPSGSVGADGHPAIAPFLPSLPGRRGMFAAGSVDLHADLLIGSTILREQQVSSVCTTSGRSGDLVIVEVMTRLFDESSALCVTERQDLIYWNAVASPTRNYPAMPTQVDSEPLSGPLLSRDASGNWFLTTDPAVLMRFSPATANTHRIHYDYPYATWIKGYEGLVVHGPLMSIVMAEVVQLEPVMSNTPAVSGAVTRVEHRHRAPLFCGADARVERAEPEREAPGRQLNLQLRSGDTIHCGLTVTVHQPAAVRP
ncbi:aldolase/citrate lyase family protein [Nocardia sp. NPDC005366]|uniref:aldolase/citrate lyase family protein n=1 Tax=Nocardia sp. NPDC005366 TaxID=3156878 RepID=UPI0033B830C3